MKKLIYLLSAFILSELCHAETFAHIDDTNFAIKWPGKLDVDLNEFNNERSMVMKSAEDELYFCILPENVKSSGEEEVLTYNGPNEYQLLQPLFDQTTCSYRIESYWTYELCHGRRMRQYHEEKEKSKLQEYILGMFDRHEGNKEYFHPPKEPSEEQEAKKDTLEIKTPKKVPVVNVEGLEFPYFQLNFTGGTPCDLTGTPRRSFIKYVCHEEGRGDIYEIKEMATCEYQIVVLTSTLCSHPFYRQKTQPVNEIKCHSMEGAPVSPKSMQKMEQERTQSEYTGSKAQRKVEIKINMNGDIIDQEIELSEEEAEDVAEGITTYHPADITRQTKPAARKPSPISSHTDNQLLREILSGDYCLTGGTGWWRYEFCFGKRAIQFHEERHLKQRTVIVLGNWDKEAHLKWIADNPSKRPRAKGDKVRRTISNMYVLGDMCELTKKPRFVEVKLKCKENPSQPHSVAIYLVEPNVCEYVLVIESPLLCSVIDHADEDGIIDVNNVLTKLDKP